VTVLEGLHVTGKYRDRGVRHICSRHAAWDPYARAPLQARLFDAGSMKITTHLDPISHCKMASGTNSSNRWTYRVFIMNTRLDYPPHRSIAGATLRRGSGRPPSYAPGSGFRAKGFRFRVWVHCIDMFVRFSRMFPYHSFL
jgi:hypothetical protein